MLILHINLHKALSLRKEKKKRKSGGTATAVIVTAWRISPKTNQKKYGMQLKAINFQEENLWL